MCGIIEVTFILTHELIFTITVNSECAGINETGLSHIMNKTKQKDYSKKKIMYHISLPFSSCKLQVFYIIIIYEKY